MDKATFRISIQNGMKLNAYWRSSLIQYFVESVDLVHTVLFIRHLSEFVNNILLLSNFGSGQSLLPKNVKITWFDDWGFFLNRKQFKWLLQDLFADICGSLMSNSRGRHSHLKPVMEIFYLRNKSPTSMWHIFIFGENIAAEVPRRNRCF